MTPARTLSRARAPKPRVPLPRYRRHIPGLLLRGLAAVGFGIAAVITAMTGLGWLIVVSTSARSDTRPVVSAPSPGKLAWIAPTADGLPGETVLAERMPSAKRSFAMPVLQPLGALATMVPPARLHGDEIVTASLEPTLPRRVALQIFKPPRLSHAPATVPIPSPAPLSASADMPLPRARPQQLASLTPVDGIPIKPGQDSHAGRTAVYDIAARMVYLPNGERLEAHSGLGEFMDDPSSMRRKNRGVTPPNTYALSLRESMFHGVQAIRLTPVNEDEMFGRAGMLAHTYMLGPSGQSNGCISFKDYARFLHAFQRGEIDRIVVVTHLDRPPAFASNTGVRGADSYMHRSDRIF